MSKKPIVLPDLTDEQWDDLGVRMLSLHLMEGVKKAFPEPFRHEDLARVIGRSERFAMRLCTGDSLITVQMLQAVQKAQKVNFDLAVKPYGEGGVKK